MIAAHADWSVDPRKRWITCARRRGGAWHIGAPAPVGAVDGLLAALRAQAGGAPAVLGIDMPLGLPRAYAATLPDVDFPAFLRGLATRPAFFDVCATLAEVSPRRPFYPRRGIAGMTRAAHAAALGLADGAALCRACDRATAERPAGAPLFWTLGANQSGRAAIAGWRDLLLPALALAPDRAGQPAPCRLWPFEGGLHALFSPGTVTVAETYPAEALRHLGLRLRGSKRRHADRVALGPALLEAAAGLGARPDQALRVAAVSGFGADAAGEDRLDSLLGLLCVLGVVEGRRPDTAPDDPWVRRWEGWVLGQTALPLHPPPAMALPLAGGAALAADPGGR